jgi:hypothetical protein
VIIYGPSNSIAGDCAAEWTFAGSSSTATQQRVRLQEKQGLDLIKQTGICARAFSTCNRLMLLILITAGLSPHHVTAVTGGASTEEYSWAWLGGVQQEYCWQTQGCCSLWPVCTMHVLVVVPPVITCTITLVCRCSYLAPIESSVAGAARLHRHMAAGSAQVYTSTCDSPTTTPSKQKQRLACVMKPSCRNNLSTVPSNRKAVATSCRRRQPTSQRHTHPSYVQPSTVTPTSGIQLCPG